MSEKKKTDANEEPKAKELSEEDLEILAENEAEGGPEAGGPEVSETEALRAEVASLKDELLRALAETENVRNRARREREDAARYAAAPLAKDLLGVADNLRRALDSVSADLVESDERVKTLVAGVEMTEKALMDAFSKHGIVRIDPDGEKLDPHKHEAMIEIPDPSKPHGTVAQVYEIGYQLHDRLLRPARVGVAKGGPAADAGQEDAAPGSTIDTEA
jgi:molecular chaperone GrpE